MVNTGISEFTFGYGFLHEQTQKHWANLKAAPILPSLQKEKDEGWDAHLPTQGTDFYFQFKLSEYLSRKNAKFIKDGTYRAAYYRISLHRRNKNRQHNVLVRHAQVHRNTYYVAPEFSGIEKFNSAFLNKQLMHNSRIIPLNQCRPLSDGDQHYITFQSGSKTWRVHSEVIEYESSRSGDELEAVYKESSSMWRKIDEQFAKELFDKVCGEIQNSDLDNEQKARNSELYTIDQNNRNRTGYLRRAAELLSVNYGMALVLVGPSE